MSTKIFDALESFAQSALMNFSQKQQMVKTVEELGELTTQLCKRINESPKSDTAQIVDEIADVLVMVVQMREVFGREAVDTRVLFKLNRTMDRIRARSPEAAEQGKCV
jgi:NTP pyrophosphatase (non-canonical NTP hydrolase)